MTRMRHGTSVPTSAPPYSLQFSLQLRLACTLHKPSSTARHTVGSLRWELYGKLPTTSSAFWAFNTLKPKDITSLGLFWSWYTSLLPTARIGLDKQLTNPSLHRCGPMLSSTWWWVEWSGISPQNLRSGASKHGEPVSILSCLTLRMPLRRRGPDLSHWHWVEHLSSKPLVLLVPLERIPPQRLKRRVCSNHFSVSKSY